MSSEEYVLKHDFGYNSEPELEKLIKLELRNFGDVKVYVEDIIVSSLACDYENGIVTFWDDNSKVQVIIEEID